jgi:hypothetical protein
MKQEKLGLGAGGTEARTIAFADIERRSSSLILLAKPTEYRAPDRADSRRLNPTGRWSTALPKTALAAALLKALARRAAQS